MAGTCMFPLLRRGAEFAGHPSIEACSRPTELSPVCLRRNGKTIRLQKRRLLEPAFFQTPIHVKR